ncbi:aromatic acid exporter family protein [Streptomyces sp. ST2-7A]|uniref:FUSC family protein n=1 Tax=Streptomyces sp. ST2-7A TaxID=2907214 RepID=UPI001F2E6832|nr:aromatic acid exporter family protein [Streptomyces sp. ST2-7A]MCE7083019.1 aromatic acid exporter family protein [Streptomyces sp. ST2-7A]
MSPLGTVRRRTAEGVDHLRRAARGPGWERDDVVLQFKIVGATVVAWLIASAVLPSSVLTFAPFTALLVLQGTVHRSLRVSLKYLAAVVVGVSLAAAFGVTAGVHGWSLAILMLLALAAGRMWPLGNERTQLPVVALFAFAAGNGDPDYGLDLLLAVALGAGCGLGFALVLSPSPHRRGDAEEACEDLARRVAAMLRSVGESLAENAPAEETVRRWERQLRDLEARTRTARWVVSESEDAARLAPIRPPGRAGRASGATAPRPDPSATDLAARHTTVNVLERVGFRARSIVRGLTYAVQSEHYGSLAHDFLTPYADLLADTATAVERFGGGEPEDDAERDELEAALGAVRTRYEELMERCRRENLDAPGEWPLYGALLSDAHRVTDELEHPGLV